MRSLLVLAALLLAATPAAALCTPEACVAIVNGAVLAEKDLALLHSTQIKDAAVAGSICAKDEAVAADAWGVRTCAIDGAFAVAGPANAWAWSGAGVAWSATWALLA